ncbi:MAG: heparinase II/III family protein [Saprospiraceae bacterium]
MLRTFAFLVVLGTPVALFSQYPTINQGRPRVFASAERLDWLRNNLAASGDLKTTFNQMQTAYNVGWLPDPALYLAGSDSTKWTWNWNNYYARDEVVLTVFLYKMTGDSLALKRCRFLAGRVNEAINTANFLAMEHYAKENLLRKTSDAGSILLDWCYLDLPDSLRLELTKSMYRGTEEFMNFYILSAFGNSYVSSHNPWNTVFCNQNILALHGAEGLDSVQNANLTNWFRVIYDKWENGFLPCYAHYRDDDGGWNWGAAYSMWSLIDQFQLFENMKIGSNKNYYTDVPWLPNSINQYYYFTLPDGKSLHLGDGVARRFGDRVDFIHAREFNDPRSLWLAQHWSKPVNTPNTMDKFNKILYRDFSAPTVAFPNIPTDWWADKAGISVSRSSWADDATILAFTCASSLRSDHQQRDQNSFAIFKNAPLLLDAGYYDAYASPHYRNYYSRTIAHNTVCVFDSLEKFNSFGQLAANDGGQIESFPMRVYADIFKPENQRGRWVKFATGPDFVYQSADAQLAYDTSKLSFFRRRILYLKPEKFIVLDNIHLKNAQNRQRDVKWVAHFVNKPDLDGDLVSAQAPGNIETFGGKNCTAKNGKGSIAIRTVLPQNSSTTRIGGAGFEYFVNGQNHPPSAVPSSFYEPGNWRIEVRPETVSDTVIFCHTIATGDTTNLAAAGGTAHQNAISVGTDWGDVLYFFSANADTAQNSHLFENVPGGRTVGIFAADLAAETYFLKIDSNYVSQVSAASTGILVGSLAIPSGNHLVEITDKAPCGTLQVSLSGLEANYTDQDPAVTLVGAPPGGVFSGAGVSAGQFFPAIAGIGEHLVSYAFTDSLGCSGVDSVWVTVSPFVSTVLPAGVESWTIFPNPTKGDFYLKIKVLQNKHLKINILNASGQVLRHRSADLQAGERILLFEKEGLTNGVYFLEISDGVSSAVQRIVFSW